METIKKILNRPKHAVGEALDGLAALTPRTVQRLPGFPVLVKRNLPAGRVGILIGGGSVNLKNTSDFLPAENVGVFF